MKAKLSKKKIIEQIYNYLKRNRIYLKEVTWNIPPAKLLQLSSNGDSLSEYPDTKLILTFSPKYRLMKNE